MRTIITLAAALLWTFLGCASAARTMPSAEAIIAAGVADGADAESLRRGRLLAATACAQCHRIYWPQEYSSLVWPELLRDMGRRASFTEPQVNDVIAYFVAAAKAEEKERADQESR